MKEKKSLAKTVFDWVTPWGFIRDHMSSTIKAYPDLSEIIERYKENKDDPQYEIVIPTYYAKSVAGLATGVLSLGVSFFLALKYYDQQSLSDSDYSPFIFLSIAALLFVVAIRLISHHIQARIILKPHYTEVITKIKGRTNVSGIVNDENVFFLFRAQLDIYIFLFLSLFIFIKFINIDNLFAAAFNSAFNFTISLLIALFGVVILMLRAAVAYKDTLKFRNDGHDLDLKGYHNLSDNINIIYFQALVCLFIFFIGSYAPKTQFYLSLSDYYKSVINMLIWAYNFVLIFGVIKTYKNIITFESINDGGFKLINVLLGLGLYLPNPTDSRTVQPPTTSILLSVIVIIFIMFLPGTWSHLVAYASLIFPASIIAMTYHIRKEALTHAPE